MPTSSTASASDKAGSSSKAGADASKAGASKAGSTSGATGTPEQAQKRKQGVSCDACKFRKVKCDRRLKLEKKQAEANASGEDFDENDVSCSVCVGHGLRCTFTQGNNKTRKGRRIIEIRQTQAIDLGSGPSSGLKPAQRPGTLGASLLNSFGLYSNDRASEEPVAGLFSVPALTRPLLDACVRAYFRYADPVAPVTEPAAFMARYQRLFSLYTGEELSEDLKDPHLASLRPLSEMLILAVAVRGAGLLEEPIAPRGSSAKFKLQERIARRVVQLMGDTDAMSKRLELEKADLVEAIYIFEDYAWDKLEVSDPLKLQLWETATRLMFALDIHRRPKAIPKEEVVRKDHGLTCKWKTSSGELITDREVYRRIRIFWSYFLNDTFRAFGARMTPEISDDQYDQDLPRWFARPAGLFGASYNLGQGPTSERGQGYPVYAQDGPHGTTPVKPVTEPSPSSLYSRFDALWLEAMLRLAFIIRTVGSKSVSPRAQGRGVLVSDLDRAISSLGAWQAQLAPELAWDTQVAGFPPAAGGHGAPTMTATQFRNGLKAFFVEILFHGQVIGTWAAVDAFGVRSEADVTEMTTFLASKLSLNEGINLSDAEGGGKSKSVEQVVRARLMSLITSCFIRVSRVAKQASLVNMMRCGNKGVLNTCAGYAIWGIGFAKVLASAGGACMPLTLDQTLSAFDDLVCALDSIDTSPEIPQLTASLRDSREGVLALLQKRKSGSEGRVPKKKGPASDASGTDGEKEIDIGKDPSRILNKLVTLPGSPWKVTSPTATTASTAFSVLNGTPRSDDGASPTGDASSNSPDDDIQALSEHAEASEGTGVSLESLDEDWPSNVLNSKFSGAQDPNLIASVLAGNIGHASRSHNGAGGHMSMGPDHRHLGVDLAFPSMDFGSPAALAAGLNLPMPHHGMTPSQSMQGSGGEHHGLGGMDASGLASNDDVMMMSIGDAQSWAGQIWQDATNIPFMSGTQTPNAHSMAAAQHDLAQLGGPGGDFQPQPIYGWPNGMATSQPGGGGSGGSGGTFPAQAGSEWLWNALNEAAAVQMHGQATAAPPGPGGRQVSAPPLGQPGDDLDVKQ